MFFHNSLYEENANIVHFIFKFSFENEGIQPLTYSNKILYNLIFRANELLEYLAENPEKVDLKMVYIICFTL